MALDVTANTTECTNCGRSVQVVDRFQDYSTTRGPMTEYVVTRCPGCGQQHLLHAAAQELGGAR